MSAITAFFAKQPFRYATPSGLHTEWFEIKKPEMISELKQVTGMEIDGNRCRVSRYFDRVIMEGQELTLKQQKQ